MTELDTDKIHRFIEEMVDKDLFSGVVLIAKDKRPIFNQAYGLASKRFGVPNRTDTKFNIGSINKIFTKIAITQLVEKGVLDFDDNVGKFLPDFPEEIRQKVTIRHLLTFTSGMGDYFNEQFKACAGNLRTVDDFEQLFIDDPLSFEPGTRYQYSNAGYVVLGKIIEVVSGLNYYEYILEYIYKPAKMSDSDHYELDRPVPNLATGYTRFTPDESSRTGEHRDNLFMIGTRGSPAGGGYSTGEDLLRFDMALEDNTLLGPEYSHYALRPMRKKAGETPAERPAIAILAGGAPGLSAYFVKYFKLGYTVIILSNYDFEDTEQVEEGIRKIILKSVDGQASNQD